MYCKFKVMQVIFYILLSVMITIFACKNKEYVKG